MEVENTVEPRIGEDKSHHEKLIESYKSMGFMVFKTLNKKLCIDSYAEVDDGIDFTLKSEKGEYLHFTCKIKKLSTFLTNFLVDDKNETHIPEETRVLDGQNQTMADIRSALFEALHGLRNGKMDAVTAKTIANVSQTLLNSCKVEMEYKRIGNGTSQKVKMLE